MQQISELTTTATSAGEFTNGSVATGVSPTILDAGWFNTIQRELIAVVEGGGLTLDPTDDTQLLAAVKALLAAQKGGRILNIQMFKASGTYTKTTGTNAAIVCVQGAGAAGLYAVACAANYMTGGAGGGSGGYAESYLTTVPDTAAVVVGAGGTATSSSAAAGGTSSFNGTIIAYGGATGSYIATAAATGSPTQARGGAAGTATGGNLKNAQGEQGGWLLATTVGNNQSGRGGRSRDAGGGGSVGGGASAGLAGSLGSGGSGALGGSSSAATSAYAGGAGGDGYVLVIELS